MAKMGRPPGNSLSPADKKDLCDPLTGEIKLIDFNDARKALSYVNRGRLQLADRIRHLTLWPDPDARASWQSRVRPTDPPMVQLAFKIRDEINASLAKTADRQRLMDEYRADYQRQAANAKDYGEEITLRPPTLLLADDDEPKVRIGLFGQLAKVLDAIGKEANHASSELADMLNAHEALEQRKIEHLDKMELLRASANGGEKSSDWLADAAGIPNPSVAPFEAIDAPAPPVGMAEPGPEPEVLTLESDEPAAPFVDPRGEPAP